MTVTVLDQPYLLEAGTTSTEAVYLNYQLTSPFPNKNIVINGNLQVTGPSPIAALLDNSADTNTKVVIGSTGTISYSNPGGSGIGVDALSFYGVSFENHGTITVKAHSSFGIDDYHIGSSWINSGTIHVEGVSRAVGARLYNGALFRHSGTIETYSESASIGVIESGQYGAIFNEAGSIIRASDSTHELYVTHLATEDTYYDERNSVALWMADTNNGFINRGILEGDIAFRMTGRSLGDVTRAVVNETTGVMRGLVDLGGQNDTLTNLGLIEGDVVLGGGNNVFSTGGEGRVVGLISGGNGNDTMSGGKYFDNLQGNRGDDSISGGDGDDWVVGGKDNDHLDGGNDADIVLGNIGNDTCEGGSGNDIVRGGKDDDLIFGGSGDDYVSGDRGNDTITGGAGADQFHGSQDAGIDMVTDFNIGEGDRVRLDPGTIYTVKQVGADTVIDMGGVENKMILVGVNISTLTPGWIFEG